LVLITSVTASTVTGYLNEDLEKDDTVTPVKFPMENVIVSLGKTPKIGSSHGVKIEPFLDSEELDMWGTVMYYRRVIKKERKIMRTALARTIEVLDKRGLATFIPVKLEVREHNGKHLGFYKHSKKEGVEPIICLKPPTFELEPEDIDYIIYHEASHGIWHTSVNSALRALWVKLFEKRVKCTSIKQVQLDLILSNVSDYKNGGIKDFIKDEADDQEQEIIKECLSYMKKVYKLSVEDIDILLQEDNIDKYWPTYTDFSKVFPDISTYSMTSVQEFFAESLAHALMKNPLPKDVKELIKETVTSVKSKN
jgi:hypothetical protein